MTFHEICEKSAHRSGAMPSLGEGVTSTFVKLFVGELLTLSVVTRKTCFSRTSNGTCNFPSVSEKNMPYDNISLVSTQ